MQISKYFASLGIEVDKSSVKKVDKALDHVENRLKKLGSFSNKPLVLSIGNFDVDQKKLNLALGNALDIASTRLTFEISRFNINQSRLNGAMINAMANASAVASKVTNLTPNVKNPHIPHNVSSNTVARAAASGAVGGGLIGRGISGFYGPALALGLGGYGLSALNQRNQQVVSAQLQSQAVVQQAGGTVEQGKESFEWLRNQANRIGFNYLDASGDYNKLLSGLTGAGMTVQQGQNVFKGFSELSRVNKLDRTTQSRLFRALSQVAGKDQLMSEELTGQIAEALPGGVSLFAEAYKRQTGSDLGVTGSASIKELLAAMKKRKVKGDILTYAAQIAEERAAPSLDAASKASQAEQARYQNSVNDMAVLASNSGVEEGFARIFRTLNAGLSESGDLVRLLAEGFNDATKWADDLLLFPQSFIRALEGKDSLVADWLGIDKSSQLVKDWQNIKQIFTDISSIKFDFLPTLESTAKEIASIMNAIAEFQRWKSGNLPTSETNNSSTEEATLFGWKYPSPAAIVGDIINNTGFNLAKAKERGRAVYEDPSSMYYQDPVGYDDHQSEMQRALDLDRLYKSRPYDDPTSPYFKDAAGYDDQQAEMAKAAAEDKAMGIVTNNSNQIDITVNVDGSTLQGMDANAQAQAIGEAVANMFVQSFDQVNVQFPVKQ